MKLIGSGYVRKYSIMNENSMMDLRGGDIELSDNNIATIRIPHKQVRMVDNWIIQQM